MIKEGGRNGKRLTKKRESDEFETHIPKTNIQACCRTARANPCKIKPHSHKRLFRLGKVLVLLRHVMRVFDTVCSWTETWNEK